MELATTLLVLLWNLDITGKMHGDHQTSIGQLTPNLMDGKINGLNLNVKELLYECTMGNTVERFTQLSQSMLNIHQDLGQAALTSHVCDCHACRWSRPTWKEPHCLVEIGLWRQKCWKIARYASLSRTLPTIERIYRYWPSCSLKENTSTDLGIGAITLLVSMCSESNQILVRG